MPAHFNRGTTTYTEEPQLPDDPLIDLLAQTNSKVEHFDLSPDGKSISYVRPGPNGYMQRLLSRSLYRRVGRTLFDPSENYRNDLDVSAMRWSKHR